MASAISQGRRYYRQESFLLTDDLASAVRVLIQAYQHRYQIGFNHRDNGVRHPNSQGGIEFLEARYSSRFRAAVS